MLFVSYRISTYIECIATCFMRVQDEFLIRLIWWNVININRNCCFLRKAFIFMFLEGNLFCTDVYTQMWSQLLCRPSLLSLKYLLNLSVGPSAACFQFEFQSCMQVRIMDYACQPLTWKPSKETSSYSKQELWEVTKNTLFVSIFTGLMITVSDLLCSVVNKIIFLFCHQFCRSWHLTCLHCKMVLICFTRFTDQMPIYIGGLTPFTPRKIRLDSSV